MRATSRYFFFFFFFSVHEIGITRPRAQAQELLAWRDAHSFAITKGSWQLARGLVLILFLLRGPHTRTRVEAIPALLVAREILTTEKINGRAASSQSTSNAIATIELAHELLSASLSITLFNPHIFIRSYSCCK